MSRFYLVSSVLVLFTGCAVQPPESNLRVAGESAGSPLRQEAVAAAVPAESLDIAEFDQVTVCEDIKQLGSRIVRDRVCYTRDANYAAYDEARRQEIELIQRELQRSREMLEQMERDRQMQRQRSLMERTLQ